MESLDQANGGVGDDKSLFWNDLGTFGESGFGDLDW